MNAHSAAAPQFFEDFTPGDRYRHARGTTVGEPENQLLTKLVMNTAQAHFNEHAMTAGPYGRRLVFGLITGSIVIGLATQDTASQAIAELALDRLRFTAPVFHGDTLYAYTDVLDASDAGRDDAGIVRFRHIGVKPEGEQMVVVFECERSVLVRRRERRA
ncbi:MAG: MaoC family dehydratase [Dehalococcoidia bacterium]|nr:MaoC family dehydratase [Dehalococcoidia bacterium]